MRISRLRLLGFKSFTEPTELIIGPGLTGVVGPNGCGKSNLLEALRWVMGESSHKSMRAASMNDVIFSGTNLRPPRNSAEVTMFLDNTNRQAPTQYNDTDTIEITRRIERDAGSAYRINGREARAKDVKILFEDAATGARSPALVRQGQIGDIVNAKPQARRRILEDAAGITGLHSRRHDAELRLNAAERNLTRLDDVMGGLTGQIESLKRQARQARRYKDVSEKIRRTQALALHLSWSEANELLKKEDQELQEILAALALAVKQEAQALSLESDISEKIQPLREEEATRAAIFARLRVELENFEREAERTRKRETELAERSQQLERDIAREENFSREAGEIITRLKAEIADNTSRSETALSAMHAAQEEVEQAQKALDQSETLLANLTKQSADISARRSAQEATLAETNKAISRLKNQIANLALQSEQITNQAPNTALLDKSEAIHAQLAKDIADIEQETTAAEAHLKTLEADLKTKREAATQARLQYNALKTERETLSKLLTPAQGEDYPAIVDSLTVTPGFETALGAALGDDLDAPIAENAPVHWTHIRSPGTDPGFPDGIVKLSDVVQGPPELQRRLAQIGVIEKSQGPNLQSQLAPGQRLVSRQGDLWRWDGFTAACEGTTAAALRLAQRNRLTALAHEEIALKEALDAKTSEEQNCLSKLNDARNKEQKLRTSWRQMQADITKHREELSRMESTAREINAELASISSSKARYEQDLLEDIQKAEAIAKAIKDTEPSAKELQDKLEEAQKSAQALRITAAKKQAALAGLQHEQKIRAERLEAQKTELNGWTQRAQSATQQSEVLTERLNETKTELSTLSDLPSQMEQGRQQLLDKVQKAEKDRQLAADTVAQAEATLKDTTSALRLANAAVSEAKERRARTQARKEALLERLENDCRRIRESLNVEPEHCLALAELLDDTQLPALSQVETDLARLKADRERLGGVNLQADDELSELVKQRDSMEAERNDVEEAIAKLRAGIAKLNREGRKRLNEAFKTVDEHFQKLFKVLFSGGEARLEMVESQDDPLEGGLEIIARPPGKKPATLSLLSGGEQTLTALSLIFAVFLTNPSPICVLDEVDAPLDDANVDRFCTLMEKMSEDTETRFLVITHHPMTMTRMNRLFGVTMAEKGISQLVSVDLETAQGFKQAS